jgi:hypothetical protein
MQRIRVSETSSMGVLAIGPPAFSVRSDQRRQRPRRRRDEAREPRLMLAALARGKKNICSSTLAPPTRSQTTDI